ncbi:MAG TPA: SCO family protein [Devosiaceae bacterium]|jgi:protein SCO1/2
MTLRTIRITLWVVVVIVAMLATGAYFILKTPSPGGGYGGGNYALVDGNGAAVTPASLTGGPSLLFFGYTHCPDVCPTTLSDMAAWYQQLGDEGKPLRAFFVTVDPERDTPAVINGYVHAVSDRITGVTGSPEEIAKIVSAWKVLAEKVPGENGDYTMNHTASVFLLNSKGQFEGTIAYGESQDVALQKIRRLIANG